MATLWIRAYGVRAPIPVLSEPGTDVAPLTFTTSAQSAVMPTGTSYVRIISDAAFHYVVGANPTATTSAMRVPADTFADFAITAGQKIAAIAAS